MLFSVKPKEFSDKLTTCCVRQLYYLLSSSPCERYRDSELLQKQHSGTVVLMSLACDASVSVLFRGKGRAKNDASKRGGRGEERINHLHID